MVKCALILILLVWVCVSVVTPIQDSDPISRLYSGNIDFRSSGGELADIQRYPYTVAIYNELFDHLIGAGCILNKYWISLAALSIDKSVLPSVIVRAGSNDAAAGGQRRTINRMIVHEKYHQKYDYMMALIKLSEPLEFNNYVGAIKMANEEPAVNSHAVLTGYGDLLPTSHQLKAAIVNVMPPENCPRHSDYCFCADAPGVGACLNDKGGPLVQNGQLIGHFLGGDNCNLFGTPGIYSNVAAYQDWIIETVRKHSNDDEMEGIV